MTSTIKVNNIQNQCGANIINESSNTITIGASGDTIALASGASQTGFGRTGTVDWQTGSIKTATFTAANGEGYFCNTTSGGFTVNLPAGSAGAIVSVQDYNNTFDSNSLNVTPNGSEKINGGTGPIVLSTEGQGLTLVYIDATVGWRTVQDNDFSTAGSNFILATGGTITTCGDFKVHTFTSPGTFTVSSVAPGPSGNPNVADYLVVAGGGAGAGSFSCDSAGGGGGGAGGFRLSNDTCMPAPLTSPLANPTGLTLTATSFPITVGGGGNEGAQCGAGGNGSNSVFSTITSAGGGGGGGFPGSPAPLRSGQPGGSGGGASRSPAPTSGGTGNSPPVSPPQGNNGGSGNQGAPRYGQGGGGGAGAAANNVQNATTTTGGNGGDGSYVVQAGFAGCNGTTGPVSSARYFAGGGGGSVYQGGTAGPGGAGGGGAGNFSPSFPASPGVSATSGGENTGGGGGGMAQNGSGGNGGSGIVIIRYKFQ